MTFKIKLPGDLRREFHGLTPVQVSQRFELLSALAEKHKVPFVVAIHPEK